MNWHVIAAGILSFVIGLVRLVLGEILIFQRIRAAGEIVRMNGGQILNQTQVRIL